MEAALTHFLHWQGRVLVRGNVKGLRKDLINISIKTFGKVIEFKIH